MRVLDRTVGKLLNRLGLSRGAGATFAEMVAEASPPETAGKPVEVWFPDAARVGQQGTLSYLWTEYLFASAHCA